MSQILRVMYLHQDSVMEKKLFSIAKKDQQT